MVKNGDVGNRHVNQETLKNKTKPTANGHVCNGTVVMNGTAKAPLQVRQRHAGKESQENTSAETVSETGYNIFIILF